jgi:hypothetical protein
MVFNSTKHWHVMGGGVKKTWVCVERRREKNVRSSIPPCMEQLEE